MRAFMVRLPSGDRYWTLLDETLHPHPEIDEFLLHLRLGRDGAESTTQSYATCLALFLQWCASIGKDWRDTGPYLGRFVHWLQYHHAGGSSDRHGPLVRGPRRVNSVMSAVRSFLRHAVATGSLPREALTVLYETLETLRPDTEFEPVLRQHRLRSRHRLSEPAPTIDNASAPEVVALLTAATNARDRVIVTAMWRMGLRRGELLGLRRSDVHFLPSTQLGCPVQGAHMHVVRRNNPNHRDSQVAPSPRGAGGLADRSVLRPVRRRTSHARSVPPIRPGDRESVQPARRRAHATGRGERRCRRPSDRCWPARVRPRPAGGECPRARG